MPSITGSHLVAQMLLPWVHLESFINTPLLSITLEMWKVEQNMYPGKAPLWLSDTATSGDTDIGNSTQLPFEKGSNLNVASS